MTGGYGQRITRLSLELWFSTLQPANAAANDDPDVEDGLEQHYGIFYGIDAL